MADVAEQPIDLAKCPYCKAPYKEGSRKCMHCGSLFPWAAEVEQLHQQLKERETNRIRATATLVQELFGAAKGGPPVSMSAIKGFVTSWLFPRTLIVIGSLVGAVILGIQTYILWNQTKMLALQTQAAQLDQSAKLRERMATNALLATDIKRLILAYSKKVDVAGCRSDECARVTVADLMKGLRQTPPVTPNEASRASWLEVSNKLRSLDEAAERIVRSPEELSFTHEQPLEKLRIVKERIKPAILNCQFDPSRSVHLISQTTAFAILTDTAIWVDMPLTNSSLLARNAGIKDNTDNGLLDYESAIWELPSVLGHAEIQDNESRASLRKTYDSGNFFADALELQEQVVASLEELASTCQSLLQRDMEALRVMEQKLQ